MSKNLFTLFSLSILSACASVPEIPSATVVPIKSYLSENRDRPYECHEYNARTDSCKIVVKRSVSGDTLNLDAEFLQFLQRGSVTIRIASDFEIGQTTYCGSLENAVVEGTSTIAPPHIIDEAIEAARKGFARDGVQCSEYLRDEQGRIYTRSRDSSGGVVGTTDRIWLFAEPKRLSG